MCKLHDRVFAKKQVEKMDPGIFASGTGCDDWLMATHILPATRVRRRGAAANFHSAEVSD